MAFTFDYTAILYNPVYVSLGVPAVLTLDDSAGTVVDVTVIDATSGIAIENRGAAGQFALETIKPVAYVRSAELTSNNVLFDSGALEDALITFNGNTWRVESHQPRPSPGGESAGEIMLILIQEG